VTASGSEVVETLRTYLEEADEHGRRWAIDPAPLVLRVTVDPDQWRGPFRELDLADVVRDGIDQALDDIAEQDSSVDRVLLAFYAATAGDSSTALVRCWFAVMAWGAGAQNRSRLRQWTRALPRPELVDALERSRMSLLDGQHVDAYKTTLALPGLGEAYLTKWLWALGLAENVPDPQPYILDARVWQSLDRLGWRPDGRNRAQRWVDFCVSVERWAKELAERRPGWTIDGDDVEQLLFDRGTDGRHFYRWLGERS